VRRDTTTTTVPPTTTTRRARAAAGPPPTAAPWASTRPAHHRELTAPDRHHPVFSPTVHYALHVGSEDHQRAAPASPPRRLDRCAARGAILVGAFNGGFKVPRRRGAWRSSVSADTLENGCQPRHRPGRLGAHRHLGPDHPVPGEAVASVRQNLAPLVVNGAPSPSINDIACLGATLARLGRRSQRPRYRRPGQLLYAGSMSAVPADWRNALIAAGASPPWSSTSIPTGSRWTLAHSGAPLVAGVPASSGPPTILESLDRTS